MKSVNRINGKTKVFGILGDPIAHTFSPALQNTLAEEMDINFAYVPFHVKGLDLQGAVTGAYCLGIQGLNVTVPHKRTVMDFCTYIDQKAQDIGAVNTLKRTENGYAGYNTDYLGLKKSLEGQGVSVEGRTVVLLGAGGAANAAAVLAASEGAKQLYIVNRTVGRAEQLAALIRRQYDIPVFAIGYDALMQIVVPEIVIQATSLGMGSTAGSSPVKDVTFFEKVIAAVDIIYAPWETKFLSDAKKIGAKAVNGFDMLIYQGIASFEIWNDMKIPMQKAEQIRNTLEKVYLQQTK